MFDPRFNGQKGIGLAEVMIASFVMVTIIAATARYMSSMQKEQKIMAAISVRDGKVNVTNAVLESNAPRILAASINPRTTLCRPLLACINDANACPRPWGSCAFQEVGGMAITGSDASPLRLDLSGARCAVRGPKCPLEIIGRYRRSPQNPEAIEVWTVVRQARNVTVPGMPRLAAFNDEEIPGKPFRSVAVRVDAIRMACNANERMVGYAPDGTIQCRPVVEARASDALQCPDGQMMRGITRDGVPVCGEYPPVWQYNNTTVCWDGPGVPSSLSCSNVRASTPECPPEPHGILCNPRGPEFCQRQYGPYVFSTFPNVANGHVAEVALQKQIQSAGQFVTSCSATGACSSGTARYEGVARAQVQVPVASGSFVRIMRCLPPVRER